MSTVPQISAPGAAPLQGGRPDNDPIPGRVPTEVPPRQPDELPDIGPTGPRTPYPVNDPGIGDPIGPGSEPDYLPGRPTAPMQV